MAKFKQMPQNFMFRKLLKYWGNMVRNYDDQVYDDDFFDIVRMDFDHDHGIELIELAYTAEELEEMKASKSRNSRLDFSEPLDDVFTALWNSEGGRKKCRAVLGTVRETLLAGCRARGAEIVEKRLADLKRVMKLDDLEAEILAFAYVRDQTCFSWPRRVEDREKPLYYAMALETSSTTTTTSRAGRSAGSWTARPTSR